MPEAVQRFPAAASLSEVGNGGSLAEAVDDGYKSDGVGSVAADTDAGSGDMTVYYGTDDGFEPDWD